MDWKTETKVTRINGWFHCRLFVNGKLFMENACENRMDIGLVCALQMRDAEKYYGCWNQHTMACTARFLNANKYAQATIGQVKMIPID